MDDSPEPEEPVIRGPMTMNPDGSWGRQAEPLVEVTGAQVNLTTGKITIFMVIDIGAGGKYSTHITLPLDSTIKEAE